MVTKYQKKQKKCFLLIPALEARIARMQEAETQQQQATFSTTLHQ